MHTFVNTFYILFLTKIQILKMSKNEKSKKVLEKASIVTEKKNMVTKIFFHKKNVTIKFFIFRFFSIF